ncbi:hypothetical protein [Kitasatospora sp. P5_F3]
MVNFQLLGASSADGTDLELRLGPDSRRSLRSCCGAAPRGCGTPRP